MHKYANERILQNTHPLKLTKALNVSIFVSSFLNSVQLVIFFIILTYNKTLNIVKDSTI